MVTVLQGVRQPDRTPATNGTIRAASRWRYLGNNPTNATDPSGLERMTAADRKEAEDNNRRRYQEAREWELFHTGSQTEGSLPSSVKEKDGVLSFHGGTVMRLLRFRASETGLIPALLGGQALTQEYLTFQQGCMGLNKLRLNTDQEPFSLPGARAFATLEAAVEVQKAMIRTTPKSKRIVITAYQDSYLDEQLKPFLLPGSKTEYELDKIKLLQGKLGVTIQPRGNLAVFDFVTVHEKADLTVRCYETMDFGVTKNPELWVKHKPKLYPPERAGTIYLVIPIENHYRSPQSPRGEK
jgi:hypothetical protein